MLRRPVDSVADWKVQTSTDVRQMTRAFLFPGSGKAHS
jgi:hypothetical protein